VNDRDVDIKGRGSLKFKLQNQSLPEIPLTVCVTENEWHARRLIEAVLGVLTPEDIGAGLKGHRFISGWIWT